MNATERGEQKVAKKDHVKFICGSCKNLLGVLRESENGIQLETLGGSTTEIKARCPVCHRVVAYRQAANVWSLSELRNVANVGDSNRLMAFSAKPPVQRRRVYSP